jgi:hypothetical protein
MHSLAYSIEGLMATMIAEPSASFRYKGEPIADSARVVVALDAPPIARRTSCSDSCSKDGVPLVAGQDVAGAFT